MRFGITEKNIKNTSIRDVLFGVGLKYYLAAKSFNTVLRSTRNRYFLNIED
jgi:hypothetical protein